MESEQKLQSADHTTTIVEEHDPVTPTSNTVPLLESADDKNLSRELPLGSYQPVPPLKSAEEQNLPREPPLFYDPASDPVVHNTGPGSAFFIVNEDEIPSTKQAKAGGKGKPKPTFSKRHGALEDKTTFTAIFEKKFGMKWANKYFCENLSLAQWYHKGLVPDRECECLRCQIKGMNFDNTDKFVLAISSHGRMRGGEPCIQMWEPKTRYLRRSDVIDALSDENCPKLKGKIRILLWCACTKFPSRQGPELSTEDERQPDSSDDASGISSSNDERTRSPSDDTSHNEGDEDTSERDSGKEEDEPSPISSNEKQPVLQPTEGCIAFSSLNGSTTEITRFIQECVQTFDLNEKQLHRSDEASVSGNIGNTQPGSLLSDPDCHLDNVGEEQNESTGSDYDEDTSDDESSDEEDLSSDASSERQAVLQKIPEDFLFVYSQKRSKIQGTWLMKEMIQALNEYPDDTNVDFLVLLMATVSKMRNLAKQKKINFSGLVRIQHNLTRPVLFRKGPSWPRG